MNDPLDLGMNAQEWWFRVSAAFVGNLLGWLTIFCVWYLWRHIGGRR